MSSEREPIGLESRMLRSVRWIVPLALAAAMLLIPSAAPADAAPALNNSAGGGAPAGGQRSDSLDWQVLSLDAIGCNAHETHFTTLLSGYNGGPERFRTIVDAGGLRYMDEDAGTPGSGNGQYGWSLYDSNSGGPTTAAFPLPPDTPVTVDLGLINGVGGPFVFLRQVVLSKCNGGTIVSDRVLIPDYAAIPTLTQVGAATFVALVGLLSLWVLRRRRAAAAGATRL